MRQRAQQQLEAQLQRLAQRQHHTKQKLRALTQHTRQEQWSRHGEYVELAGLAHVDPGTLLGGLWALATLLTDSERAARWKVLGDARLEAHRHRKAHRRRLASSEDGGVANAETEAT